MPIAYEDETQPEEKPAKSRGKARIKHRVLWVDDDTNLCAAFTRRLRRKGIGVIPASDGMQGYWLALTHRPDVIVTDLRMPRWEGEDLLDCLLSNEETAEIPVVVISGYVTSDWTDRLLRSGVSAVLEKPVEWSLLHKTLRSLFEA